MVVVQVPANVAAQQVEIPPHKPITKAERKEGKKPVELKRAEGATGAIHIRPGRTLIVSPDELEHLKNVAKLKLREIGPHAPKPKDYKKPEPKADDGGGDKSKGGSGGGKPKGK